jgi:hypothetical protein
MEIRITPTADVPVFFGRTLYDAQLEAMLFNWTASGFALSFYGDSLEMDATAFGDDFPGEAKNLPWIAVLVDGQTKPHRLIRLDEGRRTYGIFSAERPAEHTVRVVKRSENSKGRAGLHRLILSGEPRPYTAPQTRWNLEFVGDSISCGFGNEMDSAAAVFTTELENGLAAYPAVAAGLLNAAYQSVCISGIPLCLPSDLALRIRFPEFPDFTPPPLAMETQYAYTDRYHQERTGMNDGFALWDFERFRASAIVVNLGTNDAFRMSVADGYPAEEIHFQKRYTAFLYQLRRFNGPVPVIACTLGPMNYFLYDAIERAVESYRTETGDERIFCMKFKEINPWGEGFGGLGHPNLKTHERMGRELAAALKPRLM